MNESVPATAAAIPASPGSGRPATAPALNPVHLVFPTLLETATSLFRMIVVALFVLLFIVQPFRIPSGSMERTLLVGDFLLVNKSVYGTGGKWAWLLPYRPVRRGDIVVFHFPLDPESLVVKRVIGLPGDRIHLRDGLVYVNGAAFPEPYAVFESAYQNNFRDQFPAPLYTDPGVDPRWWQQMRHLVQNGELTVPAGSYFVLGDNRNNSRDSRYWGFVPSENVVGRSFVIYFSLREPSVAEVASSPDDRLGHDKSSLRAVLGFARWERMFHVVN